MADDLAPWRRTAGVRGRRPSFAFASSVLVLVVVALAGIGVRAARAAESGPAVPSLWVLDPGADTLTQVDPKAGKPVQRLRLDKDADRMVLVADESRILVLYRPRGSSYQGGFSPSAPSSAELIDAESGVVVKRIDLGWGIQSTLVDALGVHWDLRALSIDANHKRMVVVAPGHKTETGTHNPQLITVDLVTGEDLGRRTFPLRLLAFVASADGNAGLALCKGSKGALQAEVVRLPDLESVSVVPLEELRGLAMAPDGKYAYAIPNKGRGNETTVIPIRFDEKEAPAPLTLGFKVESLSVDDKDGVVLALGHAAKKEGRVAALRAGEAVATAELPSNPRFPVRTSSPERLMIVGDDAVVFLDPSTLAVRGSIAIEDADKVVNLTPAPDGRHVYVMRTGSRVDVLEDAEYTIVSSITTGRTGAKIGNVFAAVGLVAFDVLTNAVTGGYTGMTSAVLFGAREANNIAFGPDGRFAYILDPSTSDVTVVDTVTLKDVAKLGAGGEALALARGGEVLQVLSGRALRLIDTRTNAEGDELELAHLVASKDGSTVAGVVAGMDPSQVVIGDGFTAARSASIGGFDTPAELLFGTRPGPTAGPETTMNAVAMSAFAALADPSLAIRDSAIQRLLQLGPEAVPALMAGLRDPLPEVRKGVAAVLGRLEPPPVAAYDDLRIAALDGSSGVRSAALLALVRLGCHDDAIDALIDGLGRRDTREQARQELAKLGVRALPALRRELGRDRSGLREEALVSMQTLGESAAPATPELVTALFDPKLRKAAAAALASVGSTAVPPLLAVSSGDAGVMGAVADALTAMGPRSLDALIDALHHENVSVRSNAVKQLKSMGPAAAAAVPALEKVAAEDPHPVVRRAAENARQAIQAGR